jgi:hypothetical protein
MEYPALDRMERFMAEIGSAGEQLAARVGQLRAASFRAGDDLGMVWVVVDHAGRVENVSLDPRAVELTADDLGWRINETIRLARRTAAAHTDAMVAEAFPAGR